MINDDDDDNDTAQVLQTMVRAALGKAVRCIGHRRVLHRRSFLRCSKQSNIELHLRGETA